MGRRQQAVGHTISVGGFELNWENKSLIPFLEDDRASCLDRAASRWTWRACMPWKRTILSTCTRGLFFSPSRRHVIPVVSPQLQPICRVMKVHLEVWKKNYKNDMSFSAYVALQPHLTQVKKLRMKELGNVSHWLARVLFAGQFWWIRGWQRGHNRPGERDCALQTDTNCVQIAVEDLLHIRFACRIRWQKWGNNFSIKRCLIWSPEGSVKLYWAMHCANQASTVKYLQTPAEREPYRVYFSKGTQDHTHWRVQKHTKSGWMFCRRNDWLHRQPVRHQWHAQ